MEVVVASTNLLGVSGGQLIQIFKYLLSQFRPTGPGLFPSLHEVYLALRQSKQRLRSKDMPIAEYISRMEHRIGTMLASSLGNAFSVYDGYPLEHCINMNLVFDLRNIISQLVSFWVNLLLTWRFEYQINYFPLDGKLRNVIVLEEMEELLLNNVGVSGIDLITRYIKMYRATGTGLIISAHSWTALGNAPIIKNNAGALIMLGMTNMSDANSMARAMGMSKDVTEQIPTLEIWPESGCFHGIVRVILCETKSPTHSLPFVEYAWKNLCPTRPV